MTTTIVELREKQAARVRAVARVAEEGAAKLQKEISAAAAGCAVLPEMQQALWRVQSFAWAVQNLPMFDLGCLSLMKEQEIAFQPRNGGEGKRLKLFVPRFAWTIWGYMTEGMRWRPDLALATLASTEIYFDGRLCNMNAQAIHAAGLYADDVEIEARPPAIPEDVKRRVTAVHPYFDRLHLVYEAEWNPAPIKDPLVVGEILGQWFLVDQFDTTNLERYIVSEFTTRPKS